MFARAVTAPVARALGRRFISVGEKVPVASAASGMYAVVDGEVEEITAEQLFKGRKVVVFGLPGAFTPVCSASHLPGYVAKAEALKAHGVDEIVCITPNDKFVAKAWAADQKAGAAVTVLADGNLTLTKALDMTVDMTEVGFGPRSNRYSMLIEDGEVKVLNAEPNPGTFEVSDADNMVTSIERL